MKKLFELALGMVIVLFVLCAVAPYIVQQRCRAGELPDPTTLLQGVEAARLQVPPSRLRIRASYGTLLYPPTIFELAVDFDGVRRRFVGKPQSGHEVRCLFDGSDVFHFDGSDSVTIRDTSDQSADYFFDPRLLGITTTYLWSETISEALPYRDGKKIETIGRDQIGDTLTWHVRAFDSYDQQIDVWVDEKNNFRVHQYDFSIEGFKRNTTLSFFENEDYPWLPSRVETKYYRTDGKQRQTGVHIISILEAKANVNLPEETWTLAGLNPPIGATVVDLRIKQRLGYWDGKGLSPDPVGPPSLGLPIGFDGNHEITSKKGSIFRLIIIIINVVVITVLLAFLLIRRIGAHRN